MLPPLLTMYQVHIEVPMTTTSQVPAVVVVLATVEAAETLVQMPPAKIMPPSHLSSRQMLLTLLL